MRGYSGFPHDNRSCPIGRRGCSRLLLLDEPSLGLAPLYVREIFKIIETINREAGTTILLVEQNVNMALSIADYGYVLRNGQVVLSGTSQSLRNNEEVQRSYLGIRSVA